MTSVGVLIVVNESDRVEDELLQLGGDLAVFQELPQPDRIANQHQHKQKMKSQRACFPDPPLIPC